VRFGHWPDSRAQFNLLSSSLLKDLRPELLNSILDRSLSPSQVAVLTPADLASVERAKEIEAAKQAVLQQTVKTKSNDPGAIRLGRDGLERVEDYREKEMMAIQSAEREARDSKKRRNSQGGDVEAPTGSADQVVQLPGVMHHQRSLSTDISVSSTPVAEIAGTPAPPTPARNFSLSSAWAVKDTAAVDLADVSMSFGENQYQLDLSDIIADSPEVEIETDIPVGDWFNTVPVVWTGAVSRVHPTNWTMLIVRLLILSIQPRAPPRSSCVTFRLRPLPRIGTCCSRTVKSL
jgi:hypothetical protein